MAVQINSTRKAVEISWDPAGQAEPPEVWPPDFPEHPMDPPKPVDPDAHPEHPIYLPPYIWGGPIDPYPDHGLPEPPEPDQGPVEPPTEPPDLGYNPPVGLPEPPKYPYPVSAEGAPLAVQVFAQGQDGDWSNTAVMPNDGLAVLTYPEGWAGESYVEVRGLDGTLVDSGTITVE